jgi:F-type H+-transporting ATPase subunit b
MRAMLAAKLAALPALAAGPAAAATTPFFSLGNADFVVLLSLLTFIGILVYFRVPGIVGGLLDKRAAAIRSELETARALRDEAKALLSAYDRKSREAKAQAERIVAAAREDAMVAAEAARAELQRNLARRIKAAEEQIAAAEAEAIRALRERAIAVAVASAGDLLAAQMTPAAAAATVDAAIAEVGRRLH